MSSNNANNDTSRTRRRVAIAATFAVSVALSLVAATQRFGDSAHAMGMITANGGKVRHPVHLPAGGDRCMLIATATVIPPYRGDVEVAVEGDPAPDFSVRGSEPVINLGLRRTPRFEGPSIRGLVPGDRLAMWVSIRPPPLDPVCGHPRDDGFLTAENDGRTFWFCSEDCRTEFLRDPDRPSRRGELSGTVRVVLRDSSTKQPVLTIPVIFGSGAGSGHAH